MNIVCVHSGLCKVLSDLGHNVLDLRPGAGIVRLAPLLGDFAPDLLIQQETLGARSSLPTWTHCPVPRFSGPSIPI
jgi:hypothetical protein